jgi:hypothetical protein
MPGLVGGFGKEYKLYITIFKNKIFENYVRFKNSLFLYDYGFNDIIKNKEVENKEVKPSRFGSYLAGLIEGDGTFAVHDETSTAKKYNPKILIVFKKSDYPLAKYLKDKTNSGTVTKKPDRGYVL